MSYTHASIIPLIGGMTIAQESVEGAVPSYFLTYEGFQANESHLTSWYAQRGFELPYLYVDRGDRPKELVDIVNSTCPCAGLSQLSAGFGDDNQNNQWMRKTAEYVLGDLQPRVYWGENAPGFAGKIGKTVREDLYEIGRRNGYTMSVYRTKSLLHGTPQVRERAFYFFWKGRQTPLLNYFERPHKKIEDLITEAGSSNFQQEPINGKTPSKDDPYYRYLLEEVMGGMTHSEFAASMDPLRARSNDVQSYIELKGHTYGQIGEWMAKNGYEREVARCARIAPKLEAGGNIMRRGTIVPRDYIGAFVGHYPTSLTHPVHDRYITYREAMSIMGLPSDFELLKPKTSANHICQNVPVQTASDMAREVIEALEGNRKMVDSSYVFQYNHTKTHEFGDRHETSQNLVDFFC